MVYYRTFAQAFPTYIELIRQVAVATKEIVKVGEIIVRDAVPEDFGLNDWAVSFTTGANGLASDVVYVDYEIPQGKAVGLYGINLEDEGGAHVLFVDIYVGGSRVRRISLQVTKDGADTGKVVYFGTDEALIVREGQKLTIKVTASGNANTSYTARVGILAVVGEAKGKVVYKPSFTG